jgi:hypothetical protein
MRRSLLLEMLQERVADGSLLRLEGSRAKNYVAAFLRLTLSHAYASPPWFTHAVARLVTGLRVYTLAGRDSHVLDGYSKFQNVSNHVLPFRPAFPGRFHKFNSVVVVLRPVQYRIEFTVARCAGRR